jgi:putative oxidoreductase
VHWPAEWQGLAGLWQGYVITPDGAGNFKLPLLFGLMLLPLVFHGGGKLSLDHLLLKATQRSDRTADYTSGLQTAGIALLVLGIGVVWVEPAWGIPLLIAGALAITLGEFSGRGQGR